MVIVKSWCTFTIWYEVTVLLFIPNVTLLPYYEHFLVVFLSCVYFWLAHLLHLFFFSTVHRRFYLLPVVSWRRFRIITYIRRISKLGWGKCFVVGTLWCPLDCVVINSDRKICFHSWRRNIVNLNKMNRFLKYRIYQIWLLLTGRVILLLINWKYTSKLITER